MQIDRHSQRFGGLEHRPEELVVEVAAVDVTVDQGADEAVVADGALEFGDGGLRVAHRQGGEPEEPAGMLGDRGDDRVVGLSGQFDGLRELDGFDAGHVGQDLHVDAGSVHRGDPPLAEVFDARRRPLWTVRRLVDQFLRAVGVCLGNARQRVVLLERDDLHASELAGVDDD